MGAASLIRVKPFSAIATLALVSLGIAFSISCRPVDNPSDSAASAPAPIREEIQPIPQVTPSVPTPTPPAFTPSPDSLFNKLKPTPLFTPAKTLEEARQQQREMEARGLIGESQPVIGPSTRGAIITVAGKKIKIPDDAFIERYGGIIEGLPGIPTWDTPIYIIARGKSRMGISAPKGVITAEEIAPSDEGIFDWLLKELPPQKSGIRTKGSTIKISGRSIKLPDDVYVKKIIEDYVRPSDPRVDPFPGAKLPIYGLVADRKLSAVYVSSDEKIIKETVAKGAEGTFDFLKRALQ